MNHRLIKSLQVFLIAIFLFGCSDDFLDLNPLDQVVSTNFYQTEEDAFQALVAVYDVLTYQSTPGVSWAPFLTVADVLSDDVFGGGSDANDGRDFNQLNDHDIPAANPIVHATWIKNYIGIYRSNLYLEMIDGIDAAESFKQRTSAEVKFMRAYFYFEQVRFFENIPLLTRTLSGPSEYSQ